MQIANDIGNSVLTLPLSVVSENAMSTTTTSKKRPFHVRLAIHKLRVNVKSLAAEARFIRQEFRLTSDEDIRGELHCHRVHRLRDESRYAQLALACLRGVPYKRVENKTNDPVSCDKLRSKLSRFCWSCITEEFVRNWLNS